MKKIILLALCFISLNSCEKQEIIFDHPFVYITKNINSTASSEEVDGEASFQSTYYIILSSKTLSQELTVNYDFVPGNGLKEGVDYELPAARSVVFTVGLYEIPIRIRWLSRKVNPNEDNTLKIELTGNSQNFTIGFPGPAKNNSVFTITKN